MKPRRKTKEITIQNHYTSAFSGSIVIIGGQNKIAVQSMTNTKTHDVEETIKQINELVKAGCDIVRLAVFDEDDAEALKEIVSRVKVPIVADIHYDYRLALASIDAGVAKIRLNPGNIDNLEHIQEIVSRCKETKTPIRIGVNSGSINKEILKEYGNTALGLVMSAKMNIEILESLDFYDIVVSIKASSVLKTIEAYNLFSEMYSYPLHLGVTEAGSLFTGSIRSSIALGSLLLNGIGDTIRVSLTDDPVKEVKVAREILSSLDLLTKPVLVSCPTCGRCQYDMFPIAKEIERFLDNLNGKTKVAIMGCVVNGPGEAKDADIGIAGGRYCAMLFKNGTVIRKLAMNEIINTLKNEIIIKLNDYKIVFNNKINDDIKNLRTRVFINEQGFANEFDNIDQDDMTKYVSIYNKGKIIGTGRIYQTNKESFEYHIGRICVDKMYRNNRIGAIIIMSLEEYIKQQTDNERTLNDHITFIINAQDIAKEFYLKQGYKTTNNTSYDEKVLHVKMIKVI